jgi:hypothetical protein
MNMVFENIQKPPFADVFKFAHVRGCFDDRQFIQMIELDEISRFICSNLIFDIAIMQNMCEMGKK